VTIPTAIADRMERIGPRLYWWHVQDDRIGGAQSDSYALDTGRGVIFVDPLPITHRGADRFPSVAFVFLTTAGHQRASWRYRMELGARIWAPRESVGLVGEPDRRFIEQTPFPNDFRAVFTPGRGLSHYAFLRSGDPSILFVGDLVTRRDAHSPLQLPAGAREERPAVSRRSVERLLTLDFDLLCLSHGGMIDDDPRGALRELLERGV